MHLRSAIIFIYYRGRDQDSYGIGNDRICSDNPEGEYTAIRNEDCNDHDAAIHPDTVEICDSIDNDCNPDTDETIDRDYDGYAICDGDCNDADPAIRPTAAKVCDGIDDDCDGINDEEGSEGCRIYYKDADQDRHGVKGNSRCICSPDILGQYTAVYSGDPDDSDPDILGAILTGHLYLPRGWSMISLPLEPADAKVGALFPDARAIFRFTSRYELLRGDDSLVKGEGYWICLAEAHMYTIIGAPIVSHTIPQCLSGWSMLGGCSYPAGSSVASAIIRAIFKFIDRYELLGPGDNLEPSRGYWINLSEQADLTLHTE